MIRRGLTLVENLFATALLALLAATCVPVLADALVVLRARVPGVDVVELGRAADLLLEKPDSYGLTDVVDATSTAVIEVNWPTTEIDPATIEHPLITVHALTPPTDDVDHTRIVFACEDAFVVRWIQLVVDEGESP